MAALLSSSLSSRGVWPCTPWRPTVYTAMQAASSRGASPPKPRCIAAKAVGQVALNHIKRFIPIDDKILEGSSVASAERTS